MYIDAQLLLSDAQALTATAASTNVIDLGVDNNIGVGNPMAIVLTLDVAADDTDANETYQVDVETDTTDAFGAAVVIGTATIVAGEAAGTRKVILLPADLSGKQFIRLNYTLGGTTPSVTVTAFMTAANMVQNNIVYADNITIS